MPRVSLILAVRDEAAQTLACLQSLETALGDAVGLELVVVDDGSTDETPGMLACLEGDVVVLHNDTPQGWAEARNHGAAASSGEYLLFLGQVQLTSGWLEPLVAALDENRGLAAVQARITGPDGTLVSAGGLALPDGPVHYGVGDVYPDGPPYACPREVDFGSADCLLVRASAFGAVGGFPTEPRALYAEAGLGSRLRTAGWSVSYRPDSTVARLTEPRSYPTPSRPELCAHRPAPGRHSVLVVDVDGSGPDLARSLRREGDAVAYLPADPDRIAPEDLAELGIVVYGEWLPKTAEPARRKAFRPTLPGLLVRRRFDEVRFAGSPDARLLDYVRVLGPVPPPAARPRRAPSRSGPATVVVVDPRSECLDTVRRYSGPEVEVVETDPAGLTAAVGAANGEHVVVLEGHVHVGRGWLDGLLAPFADAEVGAVAATHEPAEGRTPAELRRRAEDRRRARARQVSDLTGPPGPCVAFRRAALDAVRAGWRQVVAEEVLVHTDTLESDPGNPAWTPTAESRVARWAHPLVSACMIVRDEEESLADCLLPLEGLVDEVVVVDTGSVDATAELARRFGCSVLHVPWEESFAKARNAAIDAARGTWALIIDADDRLSCSDPIGLRRELLTTPADTFLVLNRSTTVDDDGPEATTEHRNHRLFRRDRFRYVGDLHEQVVPIDGKPAAASNTDAFEVIHVGYRPTVVAERSKTERNERIARTYYERGTEARWWRAFQLARSSSDVAVRVEKFRESLEHMPDGVESAIVAEAHGGVARSLVDLGQLEEALEAVEEAVRLAPANAVIRHIQGVCLNRLGRHGEAVHVLEPLVGKTDDDSSLYRNSVVADALAPVELSAALAGLGETERAVELLARTAERDPAGFESWSALAGLLYVTDPDGCVDRLATLAATCRPKLLRNAGCLPPKVHLALAERLVDDGLPAVVAAYVALPVAQAHDGAALTDWLARLAQDDPAQRARLALWLEDDHPELALAVWQDLDGHGAELGRARCHVALGDLVSAVEALAGADLTTMAPPELLFVATLAAAAGDAPTAATLVELLEPTADRLAADELLTLATAVAPHVADRLRERFAPAT